VPADFEGNGEPDPSGRVFGERHGRREGETVTAALAAERPGWEPGSAHGHHVDTFGFLVGEVLRRATGESPGQALPRRLAGPAGVSFWFGAPVAPDHPAAEVDLPDVALVSEAQWARVLGRPTRFGIGFRIADPERPTGPTPASFGHYGYGGSLGFASRDLSRCHARTTQSGRKPRRA